MNITALILSLTLTINFILGIYLTLNVIYLKQQITYLRRDLLFLDEEITHLTTRVHKNRHDIEIELGQRKGTKQLLKG